MSKIKPICIGVFTLLIGCMPYLFFRRRSLQIFEWIRKTGIDPNKFCYHLNTKSTFANYIVFSLPTGLWILSLSIILGVIWADKSDQFTFYLTLFVFVAISYEVMQYYQILPGTFDSIDLITIVAFYFIGIILYKYRERRDKYEF